MKKTLLSLSIIPALIVPAIIPLPVWAATSNDNGQAIPEVDGTYIDPTRANTKVRVLVHKSKQNLVGRQAVASPSLNCNLADPESTAVVPAAGWKLPSNWTYNLNPSSVPATIGSANLATMSSNGFSHWQAATNNKVVFNRGVNTIKNRQAYDGQNIISWGRTSNSALAVTYVRYNTSTKVAVDVDTIVNKAYSWYWSSQANCAYSGVYDAEDILTHELGHWTGLGDTYDNSYQNNTMFGYGSPGEVKKNTLTSGDTSAAFSLYNF